jgi:preprotein translocase subunit SecF
MLNIIGKRKIYLSASGLLVAVAVLAVVFFGFRQAIDFTGGALWQFKLTPTATLEQAQATFQNDFKIQDAQVSYDPASKVFLVRLQNIGEAEHQSFSSELKTKYGNFEEQSFQSIGPSVGADLKQKSVLAIILVLVGISLYIAFAFRKVYQPVSSWKYGFVTLFTLFHDVAIPAGLLAILGHFGAIEIDTNFIVALLVVMGFSVHDTIVVFDRIRENLLLSRMRKDFGEIVNESVNQTLARSINTSFTLILVLLALLLLGPANLHYFILTLLVGVTTGIYSSIFVASPLLYIWQKSATR